MKYTVRTTLGEILKVESNKVILEKHMPGSTNHPMLYMAVSMSLQEISTYPEAQLSQEKLMALLKDLNAAAEAE